MSAGRNLFTLSLILILAAPTAFAARSEEAAIIPIGLGASSPSYVSGLGQENPAGLVVNQNTRAFGQLGLSDTNDATGGGGLLLGNGGLGAGLEYSNIRSVPEAIWGIAGRFDQVSVGVSGHHRIQGSGSPYAQGGNDLMLNAGLIIETSSNTRMGLLVRNLSGQNRVFEGGFTKGISSAVDFSLEGSYSDYGTRTALSVDPAIGLHFSPLHVSVGYGINLSGDYDLFYKRKLFYAAGLKLGHSLMVSYEFIETYDQVFTLSFAL